MGFLTFLHCPAQTYLLANNFVKFDWIVDWFTNECVCASFVTQSSDTGTHFTLIIPLIEKEQVDSIEVVMS